MDSEICPNGKNAILQAFPFEGMRSGRSHGGPLAVDEVLWQNQLQSLDGPQLLHLIRLLRALPFASTFPSEGKASGLAIHTQAPGRAAALPQSSSLRRNPCPPFARDNKKQPPIRRGVRRMFSKQPAAPT